MKNVETVTREKPAAHGGFGLATLGSFQGVGGALLPGGGFLRGGLLWSDVRGPVPQVAVAPTPTAACRGALVGGRGHFFESALTSGKDRTSAMKFASKGEVLSFLQARASGKSMSRSTIRDCRDGLRQTGIQTSFVVGRTASDCLSNARPKICGAKTNGTAHCLIVHAAKPIDRASAKNSAAVCSVSCTVPIPIEQLRAIRHSSRPREARHPDLWLTASCRCARFRAALSLEPLDTPGGRHGSAGSSV
jgi:hypothetical protein